MDFKARYSGRDGSTPNDCVNCAEPNKGFHHVEFKNDGTGVTFTVCFCEGCFKLLEVD